MNNNYYYKVLGLKPNASNDDVRKAYRRLVKKYHPDINKSEDAAIQFQKVQEAYEEIINSSGESMKKALGGIEMDFDFSKPIVDVRNENVAGQKEITERDLKSGKGAAMPRGFWFGGKHVGTIFVGIDSDRKVIHAGQ